MHSLVKTAFLLARVLLTVAASLSAVALPVPEALAQEHRDESYSTRGIVRSFAEDRRSVSIAHEAIPGFMGAMTMSFEAASPAQLSGLVAGDPVRFTFRVTSDGRRILVSIAKDAR
jgi:Cu/Ag efflux protein CusF